MKTASISEMVPNLTVPGHSSLASLRKHIGDIHAPATPFSGGGEKTLDNPLRNLASDTSQVKQNLYLFLLRHCMHTYNFH